MKKYIIKPGIRGMFSVDKENGDIDIVDYLGTDIDWMYRVPEDGTLNVQLYNKETRAKETRTYEVKEGNVVVLFYLEEYTKNPVVIVDNKEWSENIEAKKAWQEQRELRQTNSDAPCCNCKCECAA